MSETEPDQENEQVEQEAVEENVRSEVPAKSDQAEGLDAAEVSSQSAEVPVEEDAPIAEPEVTHLDNQLGDASGDEEAGQVRTEMGHDLDDFDDKEEIASVRFPQLEPAVPKVQNRSDLLNNVWVDLVVELGRKDMMVSEVANLKVQEVIELNKLAGEAFEVRVNGRIYALGEVVVVSDLMAVRITSLVKNPDTEKAKKEGDR
tara:strand:+ start:322 stop:930 length:609 start_codon:yes stop_codon:yes gene_type:complete